LPTTNAGADALLCKGSTIQLNATGALQYNWDASPYLNCVSCANPIAQPTDTTAFYVTGTNAYGCSLRDTIKINVKHPFTLSVIDGDTICVGKTVHLRASGADSYSWFPTTGVDDPNSANTTAKPTQTTLYRVVAKDNDNCFTDTGYVPVQVWQLPTVTTGVDQTIVVGTTAQLTATPSADVIQYQWTPAYNLSCITCPNPVARPKQDTKYTVQVSNGGGCTAQAEVSVFVTCGKGNLYIPNTFSPNGDGNNDIFFPRGVGINQVKMLRVFNRWGELVFERNNFNANDESAGWDGRFKGQILSADVYIFQCEIVCENNEILTYRGDLTLLK
jgi:gliding motility-associated-like protein